ncbi:MAG: divalent cation tolerance protein CutA [Caldithrix sp.]|nr:divalent cation tolerance protein CutA [Caldithrix sp.]
MPEEALLVYCTVPSQKVGKDIASELVRKKLAACCNIIPGLISIYEWNNNVEEDEELLLLIKTTVEVYPKLEKTISALHPYDVPEIISTKIHSGLESYLKWLNETTKG